MRLFWNTPSIFPSTYYITQKALINALQIQHVISNDETAVESSPTHILKNRPKYNQIRHPTTKIFTTTTEPVPVATVMPDNTVYTVKPKTKPDESKQTRIRGRIRRPGKKRTMTSTESGLEANNELPLDENYPRMPPQQPVTRQPLYDDNFDMSQFVPNQNRQTQFYEENNENVSKFFNRRSLKEKKYH